ncbi:hypothetical protein HDK90DRAFT_557046, partial [Phyllosticta capitalensis]
SFSFPASSLQRQRQQHNCFVSSAKENILKNTSNQTNTTTNNKMVSPTTSLSSSGRPTASASTCCDSVPLSNHCPTGGSVRLRPSRQSRGPPSSGAAGFSRAEVPPGDERSVLLRRGRTQQQEQGHQPPLPCPLLPPRPLLPPPAGVRTVSRALADPDWRDRRPRGDREGQLPLAPGVTAAAPQWRARVGMPMPLPPPAPWTAPQGAPAGLITPPSSASSAFSYSPSLHGGPSPSPDGAFFQYVTPRFRQHGLTPPPGLELSRGRYPIAEYFEGAEMAFPPPGSALHRRGPTESTTQHRCRWTARHERTLRGLRLRLPNLQLLRQEALEEERLRRRRRRHQRQHQQGLRPTPRCTRPPLEPPLEMEQEEEDPDASPAPRRRSLLPRVVFRERNPWTLLPAECERLSLRGLVPVERSLPWAGALF